MDTASNQNEPCKGFEFGGVADTSAAPARIELDEEGPILVVELVVEVVDVEDEDVVIGGVQSLLLAGPHLAQHE